MNTHILIPIKEWKAQRELYISKLKEIDKAKIAPSHEYYRLQGICANMDSILAHEKQISLDDKDTETKAFLNAPTDSPEEPAYPNHSDTDIFVVGYKQALKDLI